MKNRVFSTIMSIIIIFTSCLWNETPVAIEAKSTAEAATITTSIDIINKLERSIKSLTITPSNERAKGKELLTKTLKSGKTTQVNVTYQTNKSKVDINVTYSDLDSDTFYDVDLTGITATKGGSIGLYLNDGRFVYAVVYNKAAVAGLPAGSDTTTVTFNIKNETGTRISTLKISPTGKKKWGLNLLPVALEDGATIKIPITINKDNMIWDLKGWSYGDYSDFPGVKLDFSKLKLDKECDINLKYDEIKGVIAKVSNYVVKTSYPKQSGNTIMFYDTDSDGILSGDEASEQLAAANPDPNEGIEASFSDHIHSIGEKAFFHEKVSSLKLPATVTTIGKAAFYEDSMLKDISFSEGLVTIESEAFLGTGMESVTFPKSLRTLGENSFNDIRELTDINLQEGITTIGDGAFAATPITGITLPESLNTIGKGAFKNCTKLTSIGIPNGVKRIEDTTFYNCTALTDVKLTRVTHIGEHAFLQCSSLVKVQLPATLCTVGLSPFDMCDKLTELSVDPTNTAFTVQDSTLYSKDLSTVYEYLYASASKTLALPSRVTIIKEGAFQNTGIESVTLPAGLKTIEDIAFFNCEALKGIQLPEGLENIGHEAFCGCSSLTENLVLPKSMKTFGVCAFSDTGLKNVTINSKCDLAKSLFLQCEKLETVKINGEFSKIGDSVFMGCTKLKSVSLPKTLKTIDSKAFDSCSSLPKIILPQGLVNLGTSAISDKTFGRQNGGVFKGCSKLKSIVLPDSIEYIEGGSFADCQSLKSVTLPLNTKYVKIENKTFHDCLSLSSIFIPKNVKTVGEGAFSHSGLKTMTIEPNGVKTIKDLAFSETKLKEVIIPVGVVHIYHLAFSDIRPLKTVTLSSTVGDIGMNVFCGLPSCTRINFIAHKRIDIAICNFEDKAFLDHGKMHVPKNFKDGYKGDDGKYRMGRYDLVYDLPVLPNGKAGY